MTRTERRRRKRRVLIWIAVLLAVAAAGLLWFRWQQWGLQTTVTESVLTGLPAEFDGLRIVVLSDFHGREFGENSETLLVQVAAQKPDLIAVTGDLIDQEAQLAMIPALARGLAAIAPTYYVTGNHEWACGSAKEVKGVLEQCGVTVLTNQYEVLERDGAQIVLAGVDDPNGYADQKTPEELAEEIASAQPGLFTLLLAHRNDQFERYAQAGYDLILSGHGHGGIVRLPFTDGLLGTDRTFFPTWTAGLYTLGESTLFASRGLGSNTVPISGFRLFNRPDLAVLVLRSGA